MSGLAGQVGERIGRLKRVTASIRAGQASPGHEIDGLLESGFGELIALEAKLQRDSGASFGNLSDSAVAGHRELNADETLRSIEALREALSELQVASGDARTQRVGCGFVLPRERDRSDQASSPSRPSDPRSTR
jgi:hypothetical protein